MNSVLSWALENKRDLELCVTEMTGLRFLGIYDYKVDLTWLGHRCSGRGSDTNAELAIVKAIAEAVEHAYVLEHRLPNSNGVAAHVSMDLAKEAARNELLERDLWLCHYLSKTPFRNIKSQTEICGECERKNIRFNVFETRQSDAGTDLPPKS